MVMKIVKKKGEKMILYERLEEFKVVFSPLVGHYFMVVGVPWTHLTWTDPNFGLALGGKYGILISDIQTWDVWRFNLT